MVGRLATGDLYEEMLLLRHKLTLSPTLQCSANFATSYCPPSSQTNISHRFDISKMAYPRYALVASAEESIPLGRLDSSSDDSKDIKRALQRLRYRRMYAVSSGLILSMFLNMYLLLSLAAHDGFSHAPYSPASTILRNNKVVFSSGFGIEQSPFQGQPNELNNKLWESLYNFGITRISTEEARPMPNKTLPIPGDKGGYVVQLSVFHLLHCLNLVRRGLYGEVDMSNNDDSLGIEHLDHCVDHIRQSIMCSSDVAPLTFARRSMDEKPKAVAEVLHGCRDFSAVQRWALQRQISLEVDFDTVVTDDPLGWGSYQYSPGA
ncbi:hypothetical protein ONS96_007253 [Cadophora gregata f. sp. sojae]|nr:hypothetical protein ONS96_007253 [Cadophora gregata f. sp. sojae]